MTRQYTKTYEEYIEEFNDLHEAFLLSKLEDRMRSSLKRKQFTDKDGTFVIFTIDEIMKRLKIGRNKASDLLKSLVARGYVVKKRLFNATKLYLPKFVDESAEDNTETTDVPEANSQSLESKPTKVCKSNSNHSHLNKKLNHRFNTVDTEDATEKRIEKWKQSVTGTSKIPVLAVEKILNYTKNDVNKAYKIIGLINKAKYNVSKSNNLGNDPITRYENNVNIKRELPARLVHIFSYIKNARNESAYLMDALKTFFKDAFGLVKDELVKPVAKSDKPVKQPIQPEWLTNPDEWAKDVPVITDEDRRKVAEMLKKFERE
ncbi:hypothetical protein ACYATM_06620 [Lactobacillaceae bacterium Scapto_B20]